MLQYLITHNCISSKILSTRPSKMIFAVFRFTMIHITLTHCYKRESFFTLISSRTSMN